jgi:hypothetical protein
VVSIMLAKRERRKLEMKLEKSLHALAVVDSLAEPAARVLLHDSVGCSDMITIEARRLNNAADAPNAHVSNVISI